MGVMKKSSLRWLGAILLVGGIVGFWAFSRLHRLAAETERLSARLLQLEAEIAALEANRNPSGEALPRDGQRTGRSDISSEAQRERDRERYGEGLFAWVENVEQLGRYLDRHPHLSIPELELVDVKDWLVAVQGNPLATRADFNEALAKLRKQAKMKSMPFLQAGLKAYMEVTGGTLPTDVFAIAPYIENPAAARALNRYEIYHDEGLYFGMVLAGQTIALVEKVKVTDDVWFSQFCLTKEGSIGFQDSFDGRSTELEAAVAAFEETNGRAPSSFEELAPLLGKPGFDDEDWRFFREAYAQTKQIPDLGGG